MSIDNTQALAGCIANRSDPEEERAIRRACDGSREDADWLITRYRVRVVRLAVHVLNHTGEAEDAAQEAFIRAFRNLHSYSGNGSFFTWLYRITVRVCIDRLRGARWQNEVGCGEIDMVEAHADVSLEDADLRITIDRLMQRMSPKMRALVVLRELDGLEYRDIADVLQIPVGRVKWQLNAARKQFRRLWDEAQRELTDVSKT